MGAKESHCNDDDTVIMIGQDILDEIRQIQDVLGQPDSQEDAQQGRHETENIAPAVPWDLRHAAKHFDDAPEYAVQDSDTDDDE